MVKSAKEAFLSHETISKKRNINCKIISIEKLNPYNGKWEDETNFERGGEKRI